LVLQSAVKPRRIGGRRSAYGCCEGDEGAETGVGLAASGGDTPVFLELSKEVLDQMPPLVGIAVELGKEAAVGFGRDDRLNPCVRQRLTQPILEK
jgi:hypothetical protein